MLNNILDIPGNRLVFEDLAKLLRDQRAISFVGAGASAGMYPLWGEFIELLADHAVNLDKANAKDAMRWKTDRSSTPQQRVNNIVRELGEDAYLGFLKETFRTRRYSDGNPFTPVHATLLRLPFRGYVTTNYDPALEHARIAFRPACLNTATPTWQDEDEVYRWFTGDIFDRPDDCPILWLHGHWQRPRGIVLNAGQYTHAYKPGLYLNTFKRFWLQDHLVFVGFGFGDPQFTFMVGEMMRDLVGVQAPPRHIAILGLSLQSGATPDEKAVREWRDNLEADYHVRALFYPVFDNDHTALRTLLDGISARCESAASFSTSNKVPALTSSAPAFPAKWFHEPTNDDKFTGREYEIERLDRWVRDEAVRAVAICAIGGTGKTALTGHWLKNTTGWRNYRQFAGLFAWSFYQDRDIESFFRQFLFWAHEALNRLQPYAAVQPLAAALAALRAMPCLIVLDGLEVLQEGPEDSRHGAFLDGSLRDFLNAFCQQEHDSLVVLTSRFVFADLERQLGIAFHQLELHGLPPEKGAKLLERLDVRSTPGELAKISSRLDGHPLGLRVFAEALPEADRNRPRRFLEHAFRVAQLPANAPVARRITSLLGFYERKLPRLQVQLLSVVALFRAPVSDETVLRLVRGLFGENHASHLWPASETPGGLIEGIAGIGDPPPKLSDELPDDDALAAALKRLLARGILTREPIDGGYGSACHPILRDHFRAVLLGAGKGRAIRAADLLTGQPSKDRPRTLREIEPVLLAIELLIEADEFVVADDLYSMRLSHGEVFKWLPAAMEGLACAFGFVKDEERKRLCEQKCSRARLGFYLGTVGLYAMVSGQYELALENFLGQSGIYRETKDSVNLSIGLQNEAVLLAYLGRLAEAKNKAAEALSLAVQERNEAELADSHSAVGWVNTLSGRAQIASEHFALANELTKSDRSEGRELWGGLGILWAELTLRVGHPALASRRTLNNLRICEEGKWNDYVADCYWLLGACALAEGRMDDAEAKLRLAEPICHRGQLLFPLARLHVTAGRLALAQLDDTAALRRAAEALDIAAPRGMRLVHADALVLRGRVRLFQSRDVLNAESAARALDDSEESLRLARECGYAWAERDALSLQGGALMALKRFEAGRCALNEAESIAAQLTLSAADLADVEAKAQQWVKEWRANRRIEGRRR